MDCIQVIIIIILLLVVVVIVVVVVVVVEVVVVEVVVVTAFIWLRRSQKSHLNVIFSLILLISFLSSIHNRWFDDISFKNK